MSDGFAYLDIVFFAMVAAFIAFRLRSVLGRRTGHERPPAAPPAERALDILEFGVSVGKSLGLLAALLTWGIYRDRETPIRKLPIDTVGLSLLVLWVRVSVQEPESWKAAKAEKAERMGSFSELLGTPRWRSRGM